MPVNTRSANSSLRAARPAAVSEEIRRAFSDAPSRDGQTRDQAESVRGTGALERSAGPTASTLQAPLIDTVPELEDHAIPTRQGVVSGQKPSEVAAPSYEDVRAELARLELEYGSRVDRLTAQLQQLHHGQRDIRMRAVKLESAVGSISSDIKALCQRVSALENTSNPLSSRPPEAAAPFSTQTQGLNGIPNPGANNIAPNHAQSFNTFHPKGADMIAPPPPIHPQIPFNDRADGLQDTPVFGTPQLITTATSSAPIPAGAALKPPPAETGPFAPGLEPVQTMLPPFAGVFDYRRYGLSDTAAVPAASELRYLYRLKKQIDGLYPTLGTNTGEQPIALLGFLSTFKEAFEAYNTSEAIAVRTLAYFLSQEAKDVYQAQVNPRALTGHEALEATWPYVVNALIRRFLPDDVLQSAYDAVVRAVQGPSEDEVKFAQRVSDAARECYHVFQPMELVNSYVRGLHEATRERVQKQVRRLTPKDRTSLVTV